MVAEKQKNKNKNLAHPSNIQLSPKEININIPKNY
jgi:hypothetical protein